MPRRVVVDQNGLVISAQSVPERTSPPAPKGGTGGKTGAKKRYKARPTFRWIPSTELRGGPQAGKFALPRPQVDGAAVRIRAAEWARRRMGEEELRAIEHLTDFGEAYACGMEASRSSPPDYLLAIAAFKKAYRLDPRRKVRPGKKPDPGLFEVPTRIAALYRRSGRLYAAEKMYEWVLDRHDNRSARLGLAAVHEDNGEHSKALRLYRSALERYPREVYTLRGVVRTLANLGRDREAREAQKEVRRASRDQRGGPRGRVRGRGRGTA